MKMLPNRFYQGPELMKRAIVPIVAIGFSLTTSVAHAIPCPEVANMLNAGVPANIVASAIRDSGARYTASDISCLAKAGAPGIVLETARSMTSAPAAAPEPAPAAQPAPRRGIDSESDLLGSRASQPRELEDRGGSDEASSAPSPAAIKEAVRLMRNNKPLSSSLRLYDLLKSGNYPAEDTKIKYYLA